MSFSDTKIEKLFLTRADLKALGIGFSNSQALRLEALNRFPRRIRLGAATVCWDRNEIMDWIEQRKIERATWSYAELK